MMFLPLYSPDFNPTEKAFSKLKALLRKAAERTVTGLWGRIGKLIDMVDHKKLRTTSIPADMIQHDRETL